MTHVGQIIPDYFVSQIAARQWERLANKLDAFPERQASEYKRGRHLTCQRWNVIHQAASRGMPIPLLSKLLVLEDAYAGDKSFMNFADYAGLTPLHLAVLDVNEPGVDPSRLHKDWEWTVLGTRELIRHGADPTKT